MMDDFVRYQKSLLELERGEEKSMIEDTLRNLSGSECQKEGLSLLGLKLDSIRVGLYGRTVVSVTRLNDHPFPANSFKIGDEVVLYGSHNDKDTGGVKVTGVISKAMSSKIDFMTMDEDIDGGSLETCGPLRLDILANEATYRKTLNALNDLDSFTKTHDWSLARVLIESIPFDVNLGRLGNNKLLDTYNKGLNGSQIEAIEYALNAPYIAAIHGPPGTGKTTTIVEYILQCVARGLKVLVCAPSNVAVDNIVEKLSPSALTKMMRNRTSSSNNTARNQRLPELKPKIVRLGHPSRINEAILPHCLEALISKDEGTAIVNDVKSEIESTRKDMTKKKGREKKERQRAELRELRKEVRQREEKVVKEILQSRDVVLATCVGASNRLLSAPKGLAGKGAVDNSMFDVVVIDEAAQALEASCWIPMMKGRKVVLAGDHCQLPPTVKSIEAMERGLSITLFERILKNLSWDHHTSSELKQGGTTDSTTPKESKGSKKGESKEKESQSECILNSCARMLSIQYRMNDQICSWASEQMYHGLLTSHESVAQHTLADLSSGSTASKDKEKNDQKEEEGEEGKEEKEKESALTQVLCLIDTAGCDMYEGAASAATSGQPSARKASHSNEHEVRLVVEHVKHLLTTAQMKESDIGIVTPYNGQLDLLRDALKPVYPNLAIKTVDSFQGGEKEAIIISLVRSNTHGEVGFLSESRRINVAVTRAKRHLCVVCDTDTVENNDFLATLTAHMSTHGEHRSALEWLEVGGGHVSKTKVVQGKRAAKDEGKGKEKEKVGMAAYSVEERDIIDAQIRNLITGFHSGDIAKSGQVRFVKGPPAQFSVIPQDNSKTHRYLSFPSDLNSYQRAIVHESCEKLRLEHGSEGQGEKRYIKVQTALVKENAAEDSESITVDVAAAMVETVVEKEADTEGGKRETESGEEIASVLSFAPENKFQVDEEDEEEEEEEAKPLSFREKYGLKAAPAKPEAPSVPLSANDDRTTKKKSGGQKLGHKEGEKAPAKKKKAKSNVNVHSFDDDDDDALLDALINENSKEMERTAFKQKYRVGLSGGAMPNKEKLDTLARLQKKKEEAKQDRVPEATKKKMEEERDKKRGAKKSTQRNFGGGKLGGP